MLNRCTEDVLRVYYECTYFGKLLMFESRNFGIQCERTGISSRTPQIAFASRMEMPDRNFGYQKCSCLAKEF